MTAPSGHGTKDVHGESLPDPRIEAPDAAVTTSSGASDSAGPHVDAVATGLPAWTASAIAASAWVVPVAMSASSSPAPFHPVTFAWYLALRKPWFKPPDLWFPLAWTGIETGLAVSAYRLLRAGPSAARTRALALWGWNIFAIGGWSRLFFGQRRIGASVVAAASMVATGVALRKEADEVDVVAARASLPFIAWVGFATVLTAAIWKMNRSQR